VLFAYSNKNVDKIDFEKEIKILQAEIIVDFGAAKVRIKKLDKYLQNKPNAFRRIILQLKKIELFASCGDLPRMNYELNVAKKIFRYAPITELDKHWLTYFKSIYLSVEGNYPAMFKRLKALDPKCYKKEPILEVYIQCAFARYYQHKRIFNKTKSYYNNAKSIALKIKSESLLFFVETGIGQLYYYNDEYDASLSKYHQALSMTRKNKWKFSEQFVNSSIADIYLFTNNMDSSKYYFDQVLNNKQFNSF